MRVKAAALHILLAVLVRIHHATTTAIRWCESNLDEFAGLDEIVEEILREQAKRRPEIARQPDGPIMFVSVSRPRLH